MKNPGNTFIGSRVVLCPNTDGTTLVFIGKIEKAFETVFSKGRCLQCQSFQSEASDFFWQNKNNFLATDELKLAG